jgi:hypothetical protein
VAAKITCLSLKVSHSTRDAARAAAHARLNSAHSRRGRPVLIRVYRCRQCGEWHLTSQPPRTEGGKWNGIERVLQAG